MASVKLSKPISVSSIDSKKRWNGSSSANCPTLASSVLMQVAILQLMVMLLFIMPSSSQAKLSARKDIFITNNHTNILTVRCFSFYDEGPGRHHLAPGASMNFTVQHNIIFPSLSMYNCSTNMGVFIAYRYDYRCSQDDVKSCDWRFDEVRTYHLSPYTKTWVSYDYNPNYESLGRGGVIKGYFTN